MWIADQIAQHGCSCEVMRKTAKAFFKEKALNIHECIVLCTRYVAKTASDCKDNLQTLVALANVAKNFMANPEATKYDQQFLYINDFNKTLKETKGKLVSMKKFIDSQKDQLEVQRKD